MIKLRAVLSSKFWKLVNLTLSNKDVKKRNRTKVATTRPPFEIMTFKIDLKLKNKLTCTVFIALRR